jgi:hypothetical protein
VPRRVITFAVVALVCLGVLVCRAFWDGRRALAAGDEAHRNGEAARQQGDVAATQAAELEAVAEWRRAARWYVPGAPHVRQAYDRLAALGQAAETAGDRDLALAAWTGVRSSALATRWLTVPHADRLAVANQHIATLMAAAEAADPAAGATVPARRAWHLAALERDDAPSVAWSIFAVLGFLTWVGGGFWFARRGLGDGDRLDRRQAALSGVMVLAGLLLWMVALYKA